MKTFSLGFNRYLAPVLLKKKKAQFGFFATWELLSEGHRNGAWGDLPPESPTVELTQPGLTSWTPEELPANPRLTIIAWDQKFHAKQERFYDLFVPVVKTTAAVKRNHAVN